MLKHWKNPNYQPPGAPTGDFVALLVYILKSRCSDVSSMTLNQVNEFLDELSRSTSTEEKTTCLAKLIQKASVMEQKWIINIVLKDLKIGIGHETIFKHLDPRALDVYNSTSSLIEVCNFLKDPKNSKYANSFFQLFFPIKPMLAGRMTLHDIIDNFTGVNVFIETKYDGERIQCHLNNGEVKFFTRNSVDYTYLYGPKLGEIVKKSVNAKSVILDGEIVVWDRVKGGYAPFGENKSTANSEEIEKQLVYIVFDILYLVTPKGDEYSLTNVILSDRKLLLKKIINIVPKKFEVVEAKETSSIDEVLDFFNESITRAEEGIIIKKRDSTYKPDERCSDWVKMKSDYIDSLTDTLDLIIIGGYYGEGRRIGGIGYDFTDHISSFLLGVIKTINKDNPKNSVLLPIVKVGSGYSNDELEILRQRLKESWKKYETRKPPSIFGHWIPAMAERPDVYIDNPSASIILETKAAEITSTDSFPTKLTLRFPRVVKIRYDKSWEDSMKYEEVIKFYDDMQHNMIIRDKRKMEEIAPEELLELDKDKKRKKVEKFTKILDSFRDTDTYNINKTSNLFQGLEFIILNLDESSSINAAQKKSIECCIVEYGGHKVQNFLPSTTHVIANKIDIRAQNILKTKDVNIFNSKWFYDCIKFNKIVTISPIYLTYTNQETKTLFKETIDIFNDNFYEDVTPESLNEIFLNMKNYEKEEDFQFILQELKKEFTENEWIRKMDL